MTKAEEIMRRFNRNVMAGRDDNGVMCFIEDVRDPDGRMYRMEYQATDDCKKAVAFCRHNPWGGGPNGGAEYHRGHVATSGFICLGSNHHNQTVADSPYNLEFAVRRARYWATAFSVFKETGTFPNP